MPVADKSAECEHTCDRLKKILFLISSTGIIHISFIIFLHLFQHYA